MKKEIFLTVAVVLLLSVAFFNRGGQTQVQDMPNMLDLQALRQMEETEEGSTGTHFEDVNSGIAIDVSSAVTLFLETSETGDFSFAVQPSDGTKVFNVSGLTPDTTFYLYIDSYSNLQEVTTNASGSTSFSLDTTRGPSAWTQKTKSTFFIRKDATGGDCAGGTSPIGTWDIPSSTCTMTRDINPTTDPLNFSIQIDDDDIILDCNGHSITGTFSGGFAAGVLSAPGFSKITVKNCIINNFGIGISNTLGRGGDEYTYIDNIITNTSRGIRITTNFRSSNPADRVSSDNLIARNIVTGGSNDGLDFENLVDSIIEYNTVSGHRNGIELSFSPGPNTLFGNIVKDNSTGIFMFGTTNATVSGNTVKNNGSGILIRRTTNTTISDNINISGNTDIGLAVQRSPNNTIVNNTIYGNGANFAMNGRFSEDYIQTSVTGNTLDGKDLLYIDGSVTPLSDINYDTHPNAKAIFCVNCDNVIIDGSGYPANWFSNNGIEV